MALSNTQNPPEGWGSDPLSEYLHITHNNAYASFANKPVWYSKLVEVDAAFLVLVPSFTKEEDLVPGLLTLRSHAAFRAACQMALACQQPECFMLLRGALESALYGLHTKLNPDTQLVWLGRNGSEVETRKSRNEFSSGNVKKTFASTGSGIYPVMDNLYETLIDFGAHPNQRSVTSHVSIEENADGTKNVKLNYTTGDSLELDYTFKTTAQVGACCLCVIREGYVETFTQLGLDHLIDNITKDI